MINVNCNLPDGSHTHTFLQSVHQNLRHVFTVLKKSQKVASLCAVVAVIKKYSNMFIGSS